MSPMLLPGGQRQHVAIARALPRVCLAADGMSAWLQLDDVARATLVLVIRLDTARVGKLDCAIGPWGGHV